MKMTRTSYLSLIYLLLYLPIIIMVIFSFNHAARSLLWHGFTWHWYHVLFNDSDTLLTAWHSLSIATLTAIIAGFLGFLAAITLQRYRFHGRAFINLLVMILIIVPDLILAITWLLTFLFIKMPLGFSSLLIAHVSFCIPFVFITCLTRLKQLDKNLIEAAKDLGASEFRIFWKVLVPLLAPAIAAGMLMSFTLSLDDTIISYFVTGPTYQTLPLKIFAMIHVGVNPEVNAISSLLLIFTIIMAVLIFLLSWRKRKTGVSNGD